MANISDKPLRELLSFLHSSDCEELNQLGINIKEQERLTFSEKEEDLLEEQGHTVVLSVDTDWDFLIGGEYELDITFIGSTKESVINKTEAYLLDEKTYNGTSTESTKLPFWLDIYVPEIISSLRESDTYTTGGNWEVEANYNPPVVTPVDGEVHFKVLGVTLSKKPL